MWFKKFKKKKLQCFLIGLLLFLSALIFTSSFSLVTSINSYVEKYYNNPKYYDLVEMKTNKSAVNDVLNWCNKNSKIRNAKAFESFDSSNNMYYKDEKVKVSDYSIVPLENYKNVPYGISKIKSLNNKDCPGKGEIWITQLFADTHKISLGDNLKFKTSGKTINLKVTSLINSSLQPNNLLSVVILNINKENVSDFSNLKKSEYIFIDAKKGTNVSDLAKSLNSAVNMGSTSAEKSAVIQITTMVPSLIGGVAAFASLAVFIASVFIIRFIIWNNILKEYKSIGIYKALGFTKKQILKFYIMGYSLTAIFGSLLGALCSIPVLNFIGAKIIKYIGNFNGVDVNFSSILSIVLLFSLIVILNLYLVIRRTNKISPVCALRTGITSSRKKLTKSVIKNNSSPAALAVNDIFKYKKTTVYITLSLVLALCLIMLFGNLDFTTLKLKYHSNVWFSCPKSDVCVSFNNTTTQKQFKNVLDYIQNDKRIKDYNYGTMMVNGVKLDTQKYKLKSSFYGVMSMDSYDSKRELNTVSGHNPKNDNEVAVSINILKDSGLSVGDYIELSVNNKKNSYLISGSCNSLASDGYQIRMLNSEIEKYKTDYIWDEAYLNLKNSSDIKTFEKDINNNYYYAAATEIEPGNKDMIDTMPGLINPVTFLLITAFAIFSMIIVFNIIIMNIRDNRRNFGIMKALGFTSGEIRNRYLYRILILTGISSILAVAISGLCSKNIIKAAMSGMDVLIVSPIVLAVSVAAMFIVIILLVLLCSRSINTTKPTELIEE